MNHGRMKTKWLPELLAAIEAAAVAVSPQAQHAIGAHPEIVAALAAAQFVIAHLLPAPTAAK